MDYRIQQLNQFQQNSFEPAFQFNNQMSAINPLRLDQNSGVPAASFMMGYMASASVAKSERLANQRKYLSFFFQDDWKVSPQANAEPWSGLRPGVPDYRAL